MALFRLFKVPKHQRYEYKPRYWNPKKEELEQRLKRVKDPNSADPEAIKTRISGSFRRTGPLDDGVRRWRNRSMRRSNIRLFMVLIGLIAALYLILVVYLPRILALVE